MSPGEAGTRQVDDRELVLGLDIGGTKLAAGVVALDPAGARPEVLAQQQEPSRVETGPDAMIDHLVELGRRAAAAAGMPLERIVAIGIACGGPLDPIRGVIQEPHHLPGWVDVHLVERIEAALGRPAAVENDATAAAIAEHRFGAGRGFDDIVYLTISTGIGGGAISGGRVVRGATGNGAELGHLLAAPGGRLCACGRHGCLQAEASGTSIAARARELIGAGRTSTLESLPGGVQAITAEAVATAAAAGDALAREAWDAAMTALAAGVTNAINAFDPDVVILGGGVARAGDLLFEPVRRMAMAEAMPPMARHVQIVPSGLGGDLAVLAAAAVAIDRFELPRGRDTAAALDQLLASSSALRALVPAIDDIGRQLAERLLAGGRVIAFGNGGSAAEAQHLVAELVGRYRRERAPLPAMALTADTATLTAISNDFEWAEGFARQVEAHARPGDVVVAISTSGEAENVIRGVRAARAVGAETIGLTGGTGGRLAGEVDRALVMPAASTARIQELHAFVVHALSEIVDRAAAASAPGVSLEGSRGAAGGADSSATEAPASSHRGQPQP
jgi:glucokinase-like ROK family protein